MKLTYDGIDLADVSPNATLLDLRNSYPGIRDISKIKGLSRLKKLRDLDLRQNQITEITGLESLTQLQVLNLSGNRITEIKGLEKLVHLKRLFLEGNKIMEITGLDTLRSLEVLYLAGNRIREIKGLEHLVKLENIALRGNDLPQGINGLEFHPNGNAKNPRAFVDYCRVKKGLPPVSIAPEQEEELDSFEIDSSGGFGFATVSGILKTPLDKWVDAVGKPIISARGDEFLTFAKIFPRSWPKGDDVPTCLGDLFEPETFLENNAGQPEFRQFLFENVTSFNDTFEKMVPENKRGEQLEVLRQYLPAYLRARVAQQWDEVDDQCIIFTPAEFRKAVLPAMKRIVAKIPAGERGDEENSEEPTTVLDSYEMGLLEEIIVFARNFAAKHKDAFMVMYHI